VIVSGFELINGGTMWQDNISWQEGLLSEVPFKRFQAIRIESPWNSPLAIFARLNPNLGTDWTNLHLERILSFDSPAMNTLFSKEYYIVAVDTRPRTTECLIDIETQDRVVGKVRCILEYQVSKLESLFSVDDPLSMLKSKVEGMVRGLISKKSFFSIDESEINNDLRDFDLGVKVGLIVKRVFNLQIHWSESVLQRFQQDMRARNDYMEQISLNKLKIMKLKDFGLDNPIVIASVISQNAQDFDIIMNNIRNASQGSKNHTEREIILLSWIIEKGLLAKADIQALVDSLATSINDESLLSSSIFKEFLTSRPPGDEIVDAPPPVNKKNKGKFIN